MPEHRPSKNCYMIRNFKITQKQAETFLCRIKLSPVSCTKTEIKLVQLLIPTPSHLQRGIKSNLCSTQSFQQKKSIFGNPPFLCLFRLQFVRKQFYSTKIILVDTFSAEKINSLPFFMKKKLFHFFFIKSCHFPQKDTFSK